MKSQFTDIQQALEQHILTVGQYLDAESRGSRLRGQGAGAL